MIDPGQASRDAAMLSTRASKAQQEYVTDPQHRYGPGFWSILFLVIMLTGLVVWALLH
jgi:hypothetical protein